MLLRTVVLLLLYMSVGTCATLGHYQTQETEEAPAVADGAAAAASVDVGEEGVAPVDAQVDDAPAANSLFGNDLLAKIVENIEADGPEMDVPVADGATAEEPGTDSDRPGTDSDRPAGDAPAMEAPIEEAVSDEQHSSSVADVATAEEPGTDSDEPGTDSDRPAGDAPAMEAPIEEAVSDEQHSSSVADVATAEEPGTDSDEPGTDSDRPAGDAPAMEAPIEEAVSDEQHSSSVADVATAEEPGTDSDRPGTDSDRPAMEAPIEEAVSDAQHSSSENDIRAVHTDQALTRPLAHEDNSWSLNLIRNSFQSVHGYFDSLVELVGGHNGVCQYRCRYGESPQPRPGYQVSEPDGCSSSLVGFQFDLGIPAMTECCNQLDLCYETCGTNKYDCDFKFRMCLHGICSDLNKSLGFVTNVQACESMADTLYNTVWTLGCRPYLNSQRAACVCEGAERDEL